MEKQETKWFYKGLHCTITETPSGSIYLVEDLGYITKQPLQILYGGSAKGTFEKGYVERAVDNFFSNNNCQPAECDRVLEALAKNNCVYQNTCEKYNCTWCGNAQEVIDELREEVNELLGEIADLERDEEC